MYGCVMRTRHAACGVRWPQFERIGIILYVQLRMRFVVRIRLRQNEWVHVAIQNISAYERIAQEMPMPLQTCFPNLEKWRKGVSGKVAYSVSIIEN